MVLDKWETLPEIAKRTGKPIDEVIEKLRKLSKANKIEFRFTERTGSKTMEMKRRKSDE